MKSLFSRATKFFALMMCDKTSGAPCASQVASGVRRLYVNRHVFSSVSNISGLHNSWMASCFNRYEALQRMPNTILTVFFFSEMSDWLGSFSFSTKQSKAKQINVQMFKCSSSFSRTGILNTHTFFCFIGIIVVTLVRDIFLLQFTLRSRLLVQDLLQNVIVVLIQIIFSLWFCLRIQFVIIWIFDITNHRRIIIDIIIKAVGLMGGW